MLAASGGALAAAPLAGCAGGPGGDSSRLRAAFAAGGSRESLDPHLASLFIDQARAKALFDTLAVYGDDMSVRPKLARSWESDKSGTRWRIRLRPAEFHDGAPVTADDVLFSYRRIADPKLAAPAQPLFAEVDFGASRAVSRREVLLVLKRPNFEFPSVWAAPGTEIVPDGTKDFSEPVGSGPFRYGSFQPGGDAVFKGWADYWQGGPHLEELHLVPINEESARVNALRSGQVDYAHDLSGASARQLADDDRVRALRARLSTMQAVLLRTDRKPFDDPRLVRAVLLGVDRKALVRVALSGRGDVGNDLFGRGLRGYPDELEPRGRDMDEARSLVREAGARGLEFPLYTGSADASWESASSLISQQLRQIGLSATPRTLAASTYFGEIEKKLPKTGAAAHSRTATLPLPTFLTQRLRSGSPQNLTGFSSDEFDQLLDRAATTRDEDRRLALLAKAQRIAREESGMLVWGFSDGVYGISSRVRNIRAAPPNSGDWARFDQVRIV